MIVESGVPVPAAKTRYEWGNMEKGDSAWFEAGLPGRRAYLAAHGYGSRNGAKFVMRTTDQGVRIWRVE